MTVTWNIDPTEEITLGDELRIDCWDGETWQTAWATFAIFGTPRSVVPDSSDEDGFIFEDDGWNDREARIPIPTAAPPGDYRFETDFRIGPDQARSEHTIYFTVELNE
jgi:hypothetical protein